MPGLFSVRSNSKASGGVALMHPLWMISKTSSALQVFHKMSGRQGRPVGINTLNDIPGP